MPFCVGRSCRKKAKKAVNIRHINLTCPIKMDFSFFSGAGIVFLEDMAAAGKSGKNISDTFFLTLNNRFNIGRQSSKNVPGPEDIRFFHGIFL